jgi:serine-type D-Ala-D-Ala endopeptidase (penicillin-binding protein 7)
MKKTIALLLLFCTALVAHAGSLNPGVQDNSSPGFVLKKHSRPRLRSSIALIYDVNSQRPIYAKNDDTVVPIASISKLMTAMVVLDAHLPMDEEITITRADEDHLKGSHSRMRPGTTLTRRELLKLALMASENRAAAALARTYPGGTQAAVAMMNYKARELGMYDTRFLDPTGLNSGNVSTAQDLVKMVLAAKRYASIREFTTTASHLVEIDGRRRPLHYINTNPLVRSDYWDIGLSKTGYISEAGRCLVMEATIKDRPVVIVLLDSWGKRTRIGDANRVRHWMESTLVPTTRG